MERKRFVKCFFIVFAVFIFNIGNVSAQICKQNNLCFVEGTKIAQNNEENAIEFSLSGSEYRGTNSYNAQEKKVIRDIKPANDFSRPIEPLNKRDKRENINFELRAPSILPYQHQ